MALVNCPECNQLISDKAEFCPNCGFKKKSEKKNFNFFSKNNKKRNIVLISCSTLFLILIIVFTILRNSSLSVTINDIRFNSNDTLESVLEKLNKKYIQHTDPKNNKYDKEDYFEVKAPFHMDMSWEYVEFIFHEKSHKIKSIHLAVDTKISKKDLKTLYKSINRKMNLHFENFSDKNSMTPSLETYKVEDWYWYDSHRNKVNLKYASLFDHNNIIYTFDNYN